MILNQLLRIVVANHVCGLTNCSPHVFLSHRLYLARALINHHSSSDPMYHLIIINGGVVHRLSWGWSCMNEESSDRLLSPCRVTFRRVYRSNIYWPRLPACLWPLNQHFNGDYRLGYSLITFSEMGRRRVLNFCDKFKFKPDIWSGGPIN